MAPQVGFKNTAEEEHGGAARKKSTSPALIVTFVIFVAVLASYGGVKMWYEKVKNDNVALQNEIDDINAQLQSALTPEAGDFIARAHIVEKEVQKGYDVNDILAEVERLMIKKDSDGSGNRVVLQSFAQSSGVKEKGSTEEEASKSTAGEVTITGDADTFDVMAQQIDVFKKSPLFSNVTVGATDRDESGRITFTLNMTVKPYDKSAYEKSIGGNADAVTVPEKKESEESADTEQTEE